jgi:choline dehydrogenase
MTGWIADVTPAHEDRSDVDGYVQDLRRVKLLGGTSWVTRFALRGAPADYDEWKALVNPGWGFADVLPYLERLETDIDLTEIGAVALRACEAAGFPTVEDHNRPGAVGAGRMPMSSQDGIRITTTDAYLSHGSMLRNLTFRSDAQVSDIVFTGARATGVHPLDGTLVEASWVVVCAGTFRGLPPRLGDRDAAGSSTSVCRLRTTGDGRRPGTRASHL